MGVQRLTHARDVVSDTGDALARVGRAVADRRVDVGLHTQRELADTAGVALSTAALLERGKTFPRPGNRAAIEDALRWPRGTLEALRRGQPVPQEQVPGPLGEANVGAPVSNGGAAGNRAQVLALTKGLSDVAATCATILVRYGVQAEAQAALRELDGQLLTLESLISASLPHAGEAFNETLSALVVLHQHRAAIAEAARQPLTAQPGGLQTRTASAKS